MPDLTVSADIDAFMASPNDAAARTELGLTSLATTTPGTGVATALAVNIGSAGAPVLFNGAGGTPSSMVGTNITGTAAGLTAGTASAVAVGGITGLGSGVGTFLATPSSANLLAAVSDETGSGALVFGTSPTLTTSVVAGSTTMALLNTVATTVNAFGVATALNIGASAATVLNFGGFTSAAELRFLEPSGSGTNYSGFKQPALAASITYQLPTDAPANGDVLTSQTDGTLSWEPQSGAANAVTAASVAGSAGLIWTSGGADRTAVATNTITTINATTANVTNLLPVSNDGAAVGASGTAFSDLFLASGAVINFNAGNLTLTHSAGTLTSNGAYVGTTGTFSATTSLLLGTAGSAVGNIGLRNATSGTITLAPTTGALGTVTQTFQAVTGTVLCTGGSDVPVADGGTGLSSGTSGGVLAFTASGTLASSGALAANAIVIGGGAGVAPSTTTTGTGVLTALGVNVGSAGAVVVRDGVLGTPSSGVGTNITGLAPANIVAGILGGNITLGESTGQIILDPTLSAAGTWSGIMQAGTAGATLVFGDLVYLQTSDSRWELADADAASTSGDVTLGICVLAAAADGDPTNILLFGKVRSSAFPTLTVGIAAYVGTTAGDIQVAQPSGTDDVIRSVGTGLTADVLLFQPSGTYITHT